jgi:catechol-2,3-dioxygenase
MTEAVAETSAKSSLGLKFFSHATLESKDIQFTRRFFSEFLGFETVMASNVSMWARLGGNHIIVAVQSQGRPKDAMPFLNHNGLDVPTDADVDRCHQRVVREAETWKLTRITKPRVQHGTYCFYFWDADDNCWEILSNPEGGYSWMFERGDQSGAGHMARDFARPTATTGAES